MRIPMLFGLIAALAAVAAPTADAQSGPFVAARVYPSGVVGAAGVAGAWPNFGEGASEFGTSESGILARFETGAWAGYNLTRRRDWGEHDDERGGGFGGGIETAWFPAGRDGGWFAGARVSLWRMKIEWRDDPPTPLGPIRVGETRIVVVQPTLRGGYRFGFDGRLRLDVEAALGAEINVHNDGEQVGEGTILLVGLRLGL